MEKSAIEKHIKWLEAQNSNTITCDWEAGYKAAIDRAQEVAKIMAAEEKPTAPASLFGIKVVVDKDLPAGTWYLTNDRPVPDRVDELVRAFEELIQDSECYCITGTPEPNKGLCGYCKAKGILAKFKGGK